MRANIGKASGIIQKILSRLKSTENIIGTLSNTTQTLQNDVNALKNNISTKKPELYFFICDTDTKNTIYKTSDGRRGNLYNSSNNIAVSVEDVMSFWKNGDIYLCNWNLIAYESKSFELSNFAGSSTTLYQKVFLISEHNNNLALYGYNKQLVCDKWTTCYAY